jgi:hypothetical protein
MRRPIASVVPSMQSPSHAARMVAPGKTCTSPIATGKGESASASNSIVPPTTAPAAGAVFVPTHAVFAGMFMLLVPVTARG